MFIVTAIYCCSFGMMKRNKIGYGFTMMYTFIIETFIGTKSWKKSSEEDADDQGDDDGYYAFKRTRNLR